MSVVRATWSISTNFEDFCDFPCWKYGHKRDGQTDGRTVPLSNKFLQDAGAYNNDVQLPM